MNGSHPFSELVWWCVWQLSADAAKRECLFLKSTWYQVNEFLFLFRRLWVLLPWILVELYATHIYMGIQQLQCLCRCEREGEFRDNFCEACSANWPTLNQSMCWYSVCVTDSIQPRWWTCICKVTWCDSEPFCSCFPVISMELFLLVLPDLWQFCSSLFPNREVMESQAQEVSKGCLGKKVMKVLEASLALQALLAYR